MTKRKILVVSVGLLAAAVMLFAGNAEAARKPCNPHRGCTTTTTTLQPSTTTSLSTTTSTAPTTTTTSPAPNTWVSPEGVTINVATAGPFTTDTIYQLLLDSGKDLARIGPTLTIKVQDTVASQTVTSVSKKDGVYSNYAVVIYLKGVNSTFANQPDFIFAHEYGHAWSLFHLYMDNAGDWTSYLTARGLINDVRLDSSYTWDRREIIADDYRLLFGSLRASYGLHLNPYILPPDDSLRQFLLDWSAS